MSANLSRQTFLMLMGVEVAVVALIGYFFFIRGVNEELIIVRADLAGRQEEFKQLTDKFNNFSIINKLYNSLDPEVLEKVEQVLPTQPDLPDLMVNLDTLVKNNGFSLGGVEFQIVNEKGQEVLRAKTTAAAPPSNEEVAAAEGPTTTKELKIINTVLDIKGSSYGGLKNLIIQLENNLRLMDVQKFGFAGDSTSLKIELKTYYY